MNHIKEAANMQVLELECSVLHIAFHQVAKGYVSA